MYILGYLQYKQNKVIEVSYSFFKFLTDFRRKGFHPGCEAVAQGQNMDFACARP